jgi:hypothetical protein
MLKLDDFVFNAQLLALQIGNGIEIRRGSADFLADNLFETAMLGPKIFDTV